MSKHEFRGTRGKFTISNKRKSYKISCSEWSNLAKVNKVIDLLDGSEIPSDAIYNVVMLASSKDLYNALVMFLDAENENSYEGYFKALEAAKVACNKAVNPEAWDIL